MSPWLDERVAESVRKAILASLQGQGKRAKVAAVRFLPSTVVKRGDSVEMVANTIVEITGSRPHREMLESVVKTRKRGGRHEVVNVVTHALDREKARAA